MNKSLVAFLFLLPIVSILCPSNYAQQRKRAPSQPTVVTQPKGAPVAKNETQDVQKPLTHADIIRMVKAGFAENIVLNLIQTNESQFDVSMDALFELKNAGVSQKVIESKQLIAAGSRGPFRRGVPLSGSFALRP